MLQVSSWKVTDGRCLHEGCCDLTADRVQAQVSKAMGRSILMATLIHYKTIPLSLLPTIGAFESLGELRAPQYTSVKDDNINRLMIHWVGWEESFIGAESFFSLIISHFLLSCSPSDFAQSQDSCRFCSPVACWWERTVSSARCFLPDAEDRHPSHVSS